MTETLSEAELDADPPALSATSYPWWVLALGAVVLLAFGYSLLSLPRHIALARELAQAERLDRAADYPAAERHYAALLTEMPGSRPARIGMAHALFADDDASNDPAAMEVLAGLSLPSYDWDRLERVMPPEYRKLFVREKR